MFWSRWHQSLVTRSLLQYLLLLSGYPSQYWTDSSQHNLFLPTKICLAQWTQVHYSTNFLANGCPSHDWKNFFFFALVSMTWREQSQNYEGRTNGKFNKIAKWNSMVLLVAKKVTEDKHTIKRWQRLYKTGKIQTQGLKKSYLLKYGCFKRSLPLSPSLSLLTGIKSSGILDEMKKWS